MILARILTETDFGVAATFAMVVTFLEALSNFAADKIIVQAKEGQTLSFQATAQLLRVIRGLISGGLILLLAGSVATQFNVPEAAWAFRSLALIPILAGLFHLDIERLQKEMDFGLYAMVYGGSNLLVTLLAYPLAIWFKDWRAMLFLLLLREFLLTIGTHVLAKRPYRFHWDRNIVKRIYKFGTPLILNSFLMALFLQGDRYLIGSAEKNFPQSGLNLKDLGVYFAAISLVIAPVRVFGTLASNFLLPLLSEVQEDEKRFTHRYRLCSLPPALVGAIVAFGFGSVGGPLVALVFGERYERAGDFVGLLALALAMRLLRVVPTIASMAKARTKELMFANIVRVLALPLSALALYWGSGIRAVVLCALAGEFGAFCFLIFRMGAFTEISWRDQILPLSIIMGGFFLGSATNVLSGLSPFVGISLATALGFFCLVLTFFFVPGVRTAAGFFLPNRISRKEAKP
jgi:O-antigen/teichoic acid export membrane protein